MSHPNAFLAPLGRLELAKCIAMVASRCGALPNVFRFLCRPPPAGPNVILSLVPRRASSAPSVWMTAPAVLHHPRSGHNSGSSGGPLPYG